MKHLLARTVIVALALCCWTTAVQAQRAEPVAVRAIRTTDSWQAGMSRQEERPSKVPYIVGGAIGGAVLAGIGFAMDARNSSDAHFYPLVAGIVTAGSAVVGAGIGWLVYELRH